MRALAAPLLLGLGLLACTPQAPAPASPTQDPAATSPALLPSLRYLDKAEPAFAWEETRPLKALIGALGLGGGQRLLVLGSGSGYLEYPLARAVGPSGLVSSLTENSIHSELLTQKAAAAGLTWLRSRFLPSPRVAELAPPTQPFDLCLWFNSYNLLAPEPALLAYLASALGPEGRLLVFAPRNAPEFGLDTSWSRARVAGIFKALGKDFPVLKRLPGELRSCLEGHLADSEAALEACLDQRFLGALNQLRQDSSLIFELQSFLPWVQFYSEQGQRISSPEMVRLNWLLYRLGDVIDLADEARPQVAPEVLAVNTILLSSLFGMDLPGANPEAGSYSWHLHCDGDCAAQVLGQGFERLPDLELFSDFQVAVFRKAK